MYRTSLSSLNQTQKKSSASALQTLQTAQNSKSPNINGKGSQVSKQTTTVDNQKPKALTLINTTQAQKSNTNDVKSQVRSPFQDLRQQQMTTTASNNPSTQQNLTKYQQQPQMTLQNNFQQSCQQNSQQGLRNNQAITQQQQKPQQQQPSQTSQQTRPQSGNAQKLTGPSRLAEQTRVEPLFECPEGCGRKFNEKALEKHSKVAIKYKKVCKKVFQQKRKEFNSAKQREVPEAANQSKKRPPTGTGNKSKGNVGQQQASQTQSKAQVQQVKPKKSNWRLQSQAFRAIVKTSSGQPMTQQEQKQVSDAMSIDLVPCQYCGRKFNSQSAIKHIQFCEKKSKEIKGKAAPPQKQATGNVRQIASAKPIQSQTIQSGKQAFLKSKKQ